MNLKIIIGVIAGALLMYLVYPHLPIEKGSNEIHLPRNYAKVESERGIMIFMESEPVDMNLFQEIGQLEDGLLEESIEEMLSKDKHWTEKALGLFQSASYHDKLNTTIQLVNKDYSEADAIILKNGFRECRILKLK